MLLPMYFLIGVWGGPRREYAAIKFFLYTLLGSVFILIALLAFYFTDVRDFVPQEQLAEKAASYRRQGYSEAAIDREIAHRTFDLITLARVGRAALEELNGRQVENEGIRAATERIKAARA